MNRAPGWVLGAAAAAHWGPSVVSLGQWTRLRTLPGQWCTWRGPEHPRAALTFDDGPDPASTPVVLDRLDQLGLRATFFCLGSRVSRWPDLVQETARRGHQVETHGHAHEHHLFRTPAWVRRDLNAAVAALADAGIPGPRWFRPPFGQVSGATLVEARRHRLRLVLWSAWGREWAAPGATAVSRRVGAALAPGAVVLLHDTEAFSPEGSLARMLEALGPIRDEMDRRGLAAVTLDELVAPQ